jgi:hypothetical protein
MVADIVVRASVRQRQEQQEQQEQQEKSKKNVPFDTA